METNDEICFCPLMSTAEKKVECKENCLWFEYENEFHPEKGGNCQITEACKKINEIYLKSRNY